MNIMDPVEKKNEILLQLAHYFITVENYTPIIVKGVNNELWLENIDAPYRIIRINMNYIHNNEQLNMDMWKVKNIVKQVKKKTLSFSVDTLNILLDVGSNVEMKDDKKIECITINQEEGIEKSKQINKLYPKLKSNMVDTNDSLQFFLKITNDINNKTDKENYEYEKIFSKKKISITYILIGINVLVYLVCLAASLMGHDFYTSLALNGDLVKGGEVYRLITSAFLHQQFFHILMNMYALYIIGGQVENFLGKGKYLIVYLLSAITGSLLSCILNEGWALGASGAIFGLMGALLYFGLHYRLYLRDALKSQIIPVIVLNLAIGFILPGIDVYAHIGGLVGGIFACMAVGINSKESNSDRINGAICLTLLIAALAYILFFR